MCSASGVVLLRPEVVKDLAVWHVAFPGRKSFGQDKRARNLIKRENVGVWKMHGAFQLVAVLLQNP